MLLSDKGKVYIEDKEMDRVYSPDGKLLYQSLLRFDNTDLWELGWISGGSNSPGELQDNNTINKRIRTKEYTNIDGIQIKITNHNLYTVSIYYWNSTDEFVGRVLDVQNSTITPMAGAVKFKLTVGHPDTSQDVSVDDAINANIQIKFL